MKFSVTQYGEPLDPDLYTWDSETKTFTTQESYLVLDFSDIDGCTFKTGYDCTFKTGLYCTFNTGYGCTFKTAYGCTFKTGYDCTFNTDSDCTFKTGYDCTFKTGLYCTFEAGNNSLAIIRHEFIIIDLSDFKKVEFLENETINFDDEIMTYDEYKYLELVKNI
jgi:hypothetical protein